MGLSVLHVAVLLEAPPVIAVDVSKYQRVTFRMTPLI